MLLHLDKLQNKAKNSSLVIFILGTEYIDH